MTIQTVNGDEFIYCKCLLEEIKQAIKMRRISGSARERRENTFGYDIDVTVPRPQDAVYLRKVPKYQKFWKAWGCSLKQQTWKRAKVFNRTEYLTMLIAIMPGLWFHNFHKLIIEIGGAHILQVGFFCLTVTVQLLYAETFLADYTKKVNSSYWCAMLFSFCFLPMQIAGVEIESLQGMVVSIVYLSRFGITLLQKDRLNHCPTKQYSDYICYDNNVHALSQRCEPGGFWVICPDNSSYILPPHLFFYEECTLNNVFTSWEVMYLILHWIIVAYIGFKGLRHFVWIIQWTLLATLILDFLYLLLTITVSPEATLKGISLLIGVKLENLISIKALKTAFIVATDMAMWALPNNTAVAAGLLFRTNRWNDCTLVTFIVYIAAIFMAGTNYAILGCVAYELNTRTDTISRPKRMSHEDIMVAYFFRENAFGPICIALNHLSTFVIHIWVKGSLAESFTLMVAELCNKLDHQTSILLGYIVVNLPISVLYTQFAQCDVTVNTSINKAFLSIRMMNETTYSVLMFWMLGVRKLTNHHLFMYGYAPVAGIRIMWKIIPALFIFFTALDFKQNIIDDFNASVAIAYAVHFGVSFISFLVITSLNHLKYKQPFSVLFRPAVGIDPPNKRLRAARNLFHPQTGRGLLPWSRGSALRRRRLLPPQEVRVNFELQRAASAFYRSEYMLQSKDMRRKEDPEMTIITARSMLLAEDLTFHDVRTGGL